MDSLDLGRGAHRRITVGHSVSPGLSTVKYLNILVLRLTRSWISNKQCCIGWETMRGDRQTGRQRRREEPAQHTPLGMCESRQRRAGRWIARWNTSEATWLRLDSTPPS